MTDPLKERVALITGAGRGVGRATALRLAQAGACVVVNDLDEAEARSCVGEITEQGGRALACAGDITSDRCPEELVDAALQGFGALDIVVNNAGYVWNSALHKHSEAQWQAMLDIHATAPFRVLKAWAPWLRETAARERSELGQPMPRKVINVSSVSGTTGAATQAAYSAGKAAVIGLTKTLAKEWGRYNVTVNCVAFGHIETRLTQTYDGDPPEIEVGARSFRVGLTTAQAQGVARQAPLGRSGQPQDGAGAIYLLCLPEADFITGEVLTCSGGAQL